MTTFEELQHQRRISRSAGCVQKVISLESQILFRLITLEKD